MSAQSTGSNRCSVCDTIFDSQEDLDAHVRKKHNTHATTTWQGTYIFARMIETLLRLFYINQAVFSLLNPDRIRYQSKTKRYARHLWLYDPYHPYDTYRF